MNLQKKKENKMPKYDVYLEDIFQVTTEPIFRNVEAVSEEDVINVLKKILLRYIDVEDFNDMTMRISNIKKVNESLHGDS